MGYELKDKVIYQPDRLIDKYGVGSLMSVKDLRERYPWDSLRTGRVVSVEAGFFFEDKEFFTAKYTVQNCHNYAKYEVYDEDILGKSHMDVKSISEQILEDKLDWKNLKDVPIVLLRDETNTGCNINVGKVIQAGHYHFGSTYHPAVISHEDEILTPIHLTLAGIRKDPHAVEACNIDTTNAYKFIVSVADEEWDKNLHEKSKSLFNKSNHVLEKRNNQRLYFLDDYERQFKEMNGILKEAQEEFNPQASESTSQLHQ